MTSAFLLRRKKYLTHCNKKSYLMLQHRSDVVVLHFLWWFFAGAIIPGIFYGRENVGIGTLRASPRQSSTQPPTA
ncbi:MAG: hypothetical protein HC889_09120 [Synechococcaceae cyanobacterium SM1_2_3]|nr:hypothetical protein [Synechococcaceae cyanobacterium SM1_2_3]